MQNPGLFIGRFQPLHNGHVHALKEIFEQEEHVLIVIGSAQASYTPRNPFTASERIMMVQTVLEDLKIPCTRYQVIPVPDIHNYGLWVDHVRRFVPPFSTVYTGSKTGRQLFSQKKIPVKEVPLFKKPIHSGTEIRRRIVNDETWEKLVPPKVVQLVKRFDGIKRIKSLTF